MFGLAALVTKGSGFDLPHSALPWLYVALAAFVVAAIAALVANIPARYSTPKIAAFNKVVRQKWDDSGRVAQRRVALTRLEMVRTYRRGNNLKGRILIGAIVAEVIAVVALAVAVSIVLAHGLN